MKTMQPTNSIVKLPFKGTFITSNSRKNINSAIMVIETDQAVPPVTLLFLEELEGITQVTYYEKEDE